MHPPMEMKQDEQCLGKFLYQSLICVALNSSFSYNSEDEGKFQAEIIYLRERKQRLLTQSREEFGVVCHLQISVCEGDGQLGQSHS